MSLVYLPLDRLLFYTNRSESLGTLPRTWCYTIIYKLWSIHFEKGSCFFLLLKTVKNVFFMIAPCFTINHNFV